jgi:hypothetical protein
MPRISFSVTSAAGVSPFCSPGCMLEGGLECQSPFFCMVIFHIFVFPATWFVWWTKVVH